MQVTQTSSTKTDVYQRITDQIVSAIEAGSGPFEMPWHRTGVATTRPANAFTSQPYRGVNIPSLWAASSLSMLTSGYWATYKQWQLLGAHVRKGEKGSPVVFYKRYHAAQADRRDGITKKRGHSEDHETPTRWFARTSWVFNADQVEGWSPPRPVVKPSAEILSDAEAFVAKTRAVIRHGGEEACYRPEADVIIMPARETFTGTAHSDATESYYAVLFHELTHWSGHRDRLDRALTERFGDEAYAMEELVAELGASFICAECSITNTPRPDHACYIANWLAVLKNDKRAIFTATRKATE
ncbi:MAG: zincin-like metallopeptidase domain-containing protein, partial [Alphaproteobacteria bacterium]|nr:zincin-like metallopeptidase domain-containing protein [Alphaproteobacteria bacterium]